MDTQLIKSLETHSPPSESVNLHQNLGGCSSPKSSKQQGRDDLGHLSQFPLQTNLEKSEEFDYIRAEESPDGNYSDSPFLICNETKEEEVEEEENDPLISSPISTFQTSHWAEPWGWGRDIKPIESSHSSVPVDSKPQALDWSECPSSGSNGETENKPSVPVCSSVLPSEDKPSLVGAGLANLGNTCFLNAVLQCFTHTVPLVQGLNSCSHAMPCERNNEGFCVFCALRDHIEVSVASTGLVVSPWKLVNNLSYFSSSFQRFRQEDAHEFLQCLLDRLDSCNYPNKMDATQDDNFVKQVFGGRLVSKLRCCNCGHCSDTYEPLVDLSLEIEDVGALSSALNSFTKVEKIEDPETKFMCEKCKEQVSVEKQLMLEHVPSVAAFHLKRFKNDGSFVEKIDKHVEFPLELDLLPYSSGSQNNDVGLKYDLYAVVVHIGFSSNSGHYFCFIRSSPDVWYKFDDSKVVRVREDFVLAQEAYILFYAKQGTTWFTSFMETQKPSMDLCLSNTSPKSVLDNMDHICTSSPSTRNNHSSYVNETTDTGHRICTEFSRGSGHDKVEASEAEDDSHMIYAPMPLGESNSFNQTSRNVENKISPSVLEENNCNKEFEVKKIANISPYTPPRSPSPEIYKDESPERSFSIPRDHHKIVDKVSCKRQPNKEMEDSERKQACRLIKSMPSSRGSKLMAALKGSNSVGSQNKRRSRRIGLSPARNANASSARRKSDVRSVIRPLAAGSFR
ncbi:unnamed protein product [Ilex paraguariensis]|uniref:Ubiquitin carboxyl-terminal hydrolase n=1 Tax=Ilex paraguariensis TaxID=185542 RepID=A0ABC8U2W4_9AQUA